MRKDVIRGVRWAMVLSAIAIGSILVDRAIRSTPASVEAPVSVREEAAVPAIVAIPTPVPERRVPAGTSKPAQAPVPLDPVPEPPALPPLTDAAIYPHPAPPAVIALAMPQTPPAASAEPQMPVPVVTPDPAPERVTNYSESSQQAPSGNPAIRAVRSVGRVFGLGRKENEPTRGK